LNLIRLIPAKGQDVSMQASLIIARLLGPLFATIGVGMLVNGETYYQIGQQFLSTSALIYLSGIMVLLFGLAILNFHHRWTRDWRSVITAIGFIFTIAGTWRLIAPNFVPFVGRNILNNPGFFTGAGIVLIALGGFLIFKGYVAPGHTQAQARRVRMQRDFQ
jgi:hypothetical protein